MGFFDTILAENASGTATGSGGATATVEAPVKPVITLKKSDDAEVLIVNDSMTADDIGDTAVSFFDSSIPSAEVAPVGIAFDSEVVTEEEVSPEAGIAFDTEEDPIAEIAPSLEISDVPQTSDAPEVSEEVESIMTFDTPVEDVVIESSDAVATEVVAEVAPAIESSFFASSVESPVASIESSGSSQIDPESILTKAITDLEVVIAMKEGSRDAKLAENARLLEEIADLKKRAKAAQDEAKEIDASADRARALVSNLKSQLSVA